MFIKYYTSVGYIYTLVSRFENYDILRLENENEEYLCALMNNLAKHHDIRCAFEALDALDKKHKTTLLFHNDDDVSFIGALNDFDTVFIDSERIRYLLERRDTIPKYKHIQLHPHNEIAFLQCLNNDRDREAFIQATGTGKSYLTAALAQKVYPLNCAVISSSTFILDQQSKIIEDSANIHYLTYQRVTSSLEIAVQECESVDVFFLDEFHRAGAEQWSLKLRDLLESKPNARIYGTTATHIRYLDEQRNMVDELFTGNVCSSLSLTEAIARNILPNPRYVSGVYDIANIKSDYTDAINNSRNTFAEKNNMINTLEGIVVEWQSFEGVDCLLKKHIKEGDDKFIVFCQNIQQVNVVSSMLPKWFNQAGTMDVRSYFLSSKTTKGINKSELHGFEQDNSEGIKLLFTVDMLNEGRHINGISGAFLFRKTTSPNLFYQQIGRAFDAGSKESPLIFDLVGNINTIHSNLFTQELEQSIASESGRRIKQGLPPVTYDGAIADYCLSVLDKLQEIDSQLTAKTISTEERTVLLEEHFKEFGHSYIISKAVYSGLPISKYATAIRSAYKDGVIKESTVKRLQAISFDWDYLTSLFNLGIEALKLYKQQHGKLSIPVKYYYKGLNIHQWTHSQRKKYKDDTLSVDHKRELVNLGFLFNVMQDKNDLCMQYLKSYKTEYGHCNFPYNYVVNDEELGTWAVRQRILLKNKKLPEERYKQLTELDFIFDKSDYEFEVRYTLLHTYFKDNNDLKLPVKYTVGGIDLHTYLRGLRERIKKGMNVFRNNTDDKLKRLQLIGFHADLMEEAMSESIDMLNNHIDTSNSKLNRKSGLYRRYKRLKIKYDENALSDSLMKKFKPLMENSVFTE